MKVEYFEHTENPRQAEFERELYHRKRAEFEYSRYRRNNLFAAILGVSGLIILLTKDLIYSISEEYGIIFTLFGGINFSLGIGLLLYRYLQNGNFSTLSSLNYSEQSIRAELQDLKFELLKLRKKGGVYNDSENISQTINNAINNTLTEDFIKDKIDSLYSEKAIIESRYKNLLDDFENLAYRINGELIRLRKSANLNLVIGTLTTALAITALGYEVFKNEFEFSDTVKVLTHYLPRLSLIVFIEIFAFFFLKLYKATLSDIKYFNNEKTNIDFKIISLKTALNNKDSEILKYLLQELVKTERNFKLKKDESTVEIEKLKNEMTNNQILVQLLEKLKLKNNGSR